MAIRFIDSKIASSILEVINTDPEFRIAARYFGLSEGSDQV